MPEFATQTVFSHIACVNELKEAHEAIGLIADMVCAPDDDDLSLGGVVRAVEEACKSRSHRGDSSPADGSVHGDTLLWKESRFSECILNTVALPIFGSAFPTSTRLVGGEAFEQQNEIYRVIGFNRRKSTNGVAAVREAVFLDKDRMITVQDVEHFSTEKVSMQVNGISVIHDAQRERVERYAGALGIESNDPTLVDIKPRHKRPILMIEPNGNAKACTIHEFKKRRMGEIVSW